MWYFIVFSVITIILAIFDIKPMKKAGLEKEVKIYYLLTLITGVLGFIYYSEPHRESISEIMMDLLKIHV